MDGNAIATAVVSVALFLLGAGAIALGKSRRWDE